MQTQNQASKEALERANEWANNTYFDEETRNEIKTLLDSQNAQEIEERFYKDLEFGTGGMRSILGVGTNRMNVYNIRKATQALCLEVLEYSKENNITQPSIAISYDSRRFSFEFAKEAASVMAGNGIKAYIFKRLNPVALLSFSVRHHNSQAGVMVTASHNPPEYNGYKVYWNDGAQVTPPNDQNIIDKFYAIKDFSTIKRVDFEDGVKRDLISWVGEDVENAYYDAILSKTIRPDFCRENGSDLKIVYTPIHGTGLLPCKRALNDLGFSNVEIVKEQAEPDSDFPTVSSPNPENPSALKMAVDLMQETNADIVMGSDPDTDRLGVAHKHDGKIEYLNGNQIGVLMLHYILSNFKGQGKLSDNSYFVKTIVTTPLQDVIAKAFNVEIFNTLTGFKWICGKMNQLERTSPEKEFVFATEESFGYLPHTFARDKDGIASVTLMAEVALFYKKQGKSLTEALDSIYEEYGFSKETLVNKVYQGKAGAEKITRIMDHFRSLKPSTLCGLDIQVIEDYLAGMTIDLETNKSTDLNMPKSNVIGYHFKDGSRLYLRPSGTEPKIKFYIMIQVASGSLEEKKKLASDTTEKFLAFIDETTESL
ncbi:MAG: phospho-sugar mutase [Bdellovibrionota bacterium]|nr:phospho-sugar mutase [Bdellovibrionota bacterium]